MKKLLLALIAIIVAVGFFAFKNNLLIKDCSKWIKFNYPHAEATGEIPACWFKESQENSNYNDFYAMSYNPYTMRGSKVDWSKYKGHAGMSIMKEKLNEFHSIPSLDKYVNDWNKDNSIVETVEINGTTFKKFERTDKLIDGDKTLFTDYKTYYLTYKNGNYYNFSITQNGSKEKKNAATIDRIVKSLVIQ